MNTLIAQIEKQVAYLEKRINGFFTKLDMNNPMSVMANAEEICKMQNEYEQIKCLNYTLLCMEHGDTLQKRVSQMANEIMIQSINKSTCQASNAIELYRFNGKREAYIFLVELFKTIK